MGDIDDREQTGQSANSEGVELKAEEIASGEIEGLEKELSELKDKYVRLYADFENYKKRVMREKEELLKYGNESLMSELITVVDHLELAIQHSKDSTEGIVEGVDITLKEMQNILKKYGISKIEALGEPFNPQLHHAMAQIESEGHENMVVEEFRKGYFFNDRLLRPAYVGVSKKPENNQDSKETENITENIKED